MPRLMIALSASRLMTEVIVETCDQMLKEKSSRISAPRIAPIDGLAKNPSETLRKISDIYDRIAFAGVGKYNEFDQLRIAGVRRLHGIKVDSIRILKNRQVIEVFTSLFFLVLLVRLHARSGTGRRATRFGLLSCSAFGSFLLFEILVFRTFVFRTLFVSHVIQPCFLVIES